jgi:hypothetical protein
MLPVKIRPFCCLAALLALLGCNPCSEEIWGNVDSPNGQWTATTLTRDCGATTPETMSVNVHRKDSRRFSADQSALVMKHGQAPTIVGQAMTRFCSIAAHAPAAMRSQGRPRLAPFISPSDLLNLSLPRPELDPACKVWFSVSSRRGHSSCVEIELFQKACCGAPRKGLILEAEKCRRLSAGSKWFWHEHSGWSTLQNSAPGSF